MVATPRAGMSFTNVRRFRHLLPDCRNWSCLPSFRAGRFFFILVSSKIEIATVQLAGIACGDGLPYLSLRTLVLRNRLYGHDEHVVVFSLRDNWKRSAAECCDNCGDTIVVSGGEHNTTSIVRLDLPAPVHRRFANLFD